uniref:Uncharacterized protein n=1 Tax=Arundo donax TaxID=35708 RepID=A0A0A9H6Q9_ARUDO
MCMIACPSLFSLQVRRRVQNGMN